MPWLPMMYINQLSQVFMAPVVFRVTFFEVKSQLVNVGPTAIAQWPTVRTYRLRRLAHAGTMLD
jgi:hypothetical protein